MKVLVTGVAGFIGAHVAKFLLERGDDVVGVDNLNDYYDVKLKNARLKNISAHCQLLRKEKRLCGNFIFIPMALFKFTQAILNGEPIDVFNYGKHKRDFTYIDDIVNGIIKTLDQNAEPNNNWSGVTPDPSSSKAPWVVYNIGNNSPVALLHYIETLEKALGKSAKKVLKPMQPGDVPDTFASIDKLSTNVGYQPSTSVEQGIGKFVDWYLDYCHKM